MPHDLFGDVPTRPPAVDSRRSSLVLLSFGLHGCVLLVAVAASIVAPDALPFPRRVLAFYEPVHLVDIDLPAPPRRSSRRAPSKPMLANEHAAPVVVPGEIGEESRREGLPPPTPGEVTGAWDAIDAPGVVVSPAAPPPPPPAPPVPEPAIRLHAGIRAPVKTRDVAPVYPVLARQSRVEGLVIIEATIDVSGTVQAAHVLRSAPLLAEAALEAVRQWRYEPAQLNGQPVAVIVTITVRFTLE